MVNFISSRAALEALAASEKTEVDPADPVTKSLAESGLIKIDKSKFASLTKAGKHAAEAQAALGSGTPPAMQPATDGSPAEGAEPPPAVNNIETVKAHDRAARKAPPVKETDEDRAVADKVYLANVDELRQYIEQFEALDEEKKELAIEQKNLMSNAKSRGFNTKAIRIVMRERKRKPHELAEENSFADLYRAALGMA